MVKKSLSRLRTGVFLPTKTPMLTFIKKYFYCRFSRFRSCRVQIRGLKKIQVHGLEILFLTVNSSITLLTWGFWAVWGRSWSKRPRHVYIIEKHSTRGVHFRCQKCVLACSGVLAMIWRKNSTPNSEVVVFQRLGYFGPEWSNLVQFTAKYHVLVIAQH